ncbi:MAG: glutamate synthase large subunit [Chloroflexota bacterium]|nr:glutamate synthase large subunit [Chloroflexota bacterium]
MLIDSSSRFPGLPEKQGLYDPRYERDACGVGFVVNVKGRKSHQIIQQALTILLNLAHRGARGAESNTGDGAGILFQLPHLFFQQVCPAANMELPMPGEYGVGMLFLSPDVASRRAAETAVAQVVEEEGQQLLGWRTVPTEAASLGATARLAEPLVRQVFIGRNPGTLTAGDALVFERKLFVIRRRLENLARRPDWAGGHPFYFASLSSRTIVYKGMLLSEQVKAFFPDLADPRLESALAVVHSRFSTNTFPSWERAHPYRYLIHNGEINTLRGNINWMHARQSMLESDLFGDDLPKILPIIDPDGSDSAMFDNALEFLHLAGRTLPHAVMMMIPEPWSKHQSMSDGKRAFYEYHATLMEPWDGPASIAFTDGAVVGAVLDRNGLRPSRYYVTEDDLVVMASEVGVLDIPPERVLHKGRLEPGRMFLVDTEEGRIIDDQELKQRYATQYPYRAWLDQHLVPLEDLPDPPVMDGLRHTDDIDEPPVLLQGAVKTGHRAIVQMQQAFGYTFETLRVFLAPMAEKGIEPLGAMGNDTPLAVLSDRPQLLFNYFKQLFAQVTNPPIDAIREELVTSTMVMMGTEQNLLETKPENCHQVRLKTPILTNAEMARLRHIREPGFKARTLSTVFRLADGGAGLEQALDDLCRKAEEAIAQGVNILILSDRGVSRELAPIPALLALSGLHHHLIREELRTQVALVVESGEPREVHHFALLIGYGATAINPYLAYESLRDMIDEGLLTGVDYHKAESQYIKAVVKGVVKVLSKMGISTMQSYCGAQIFEAVGLSQALVDTYFTGTPSRIEGIGLNEVFQEVHTRHQLAFPERFFNGKTLPAGGDYQWRHGGERHVLNPRTVHTLQRACLTGDHDTFLAFADMMNNQETEHNTLRGLLALKPCQEPVPLEEVESVDSICRRFKTGAMSYGSISQETHEALAIAMNRIGGKSNTGEGGEDSARFPAMDPLTGEPVSEGDNRSSAVKQVASGRFGVTSNYLVNARELQIKMAQGAKPGEGGQLPGRKVYPWIARVRHSTPGVGLISPPPHHDIYSIEDLAELIHDLKNANERARINVKLVSEVGVGTIAAGVAKGHADVILISGHDGGTGASPQTSIKHAGLPWELGLAETHQTLVLNNLRSRVVLETDGQLRTGRDVVIAALLGAEEYGFGTVALVTLGCIMMRVCHLDTCPVGVATQNPELRKKFAGDPQYLVNYMRFVAQEMRELMASLGFRTVDEMIGRTDRLETRQAVAHWKARGLDLSSLLYRPEVPDTVGRYHQINQDHGLDDALDKKVLLDLCKPALDGQKEVRAKLPICNTDRVVGTILGSELTRRFGEEGLPEDTIHLTFHGSAGQSFGAFLPAGITLALEGDTNDYLGKGLSGGKIIVYPPEESGFVAEENVISGNVAFYGATGGEAYVRGLAGERFCVRNSGVDAVVEGVGDHGCEYMTGGRVVVLGKTGRNFAAGMSGGVAYVLDEKGDFAGRCNQAMVILERLQDCTADEIAGVKCMIEKHAEYTGSALAWRVLLRWNELVARFVKVLPRDYKRMLEAFAEMDAAGLAGDEAVMAAFEKNRDDLTRIGGQ